MALGTTNISLSYIKNLLGETTYSLFDLCTSALINKWSKYKPIRDAGAGANWPDGLDSHYGLNIVENTNTDNWKHLTPRGGAPGGATDEPGRLGDFRGYEHDTSLAFPTMHLLSSESTVDDLHPVNGPISNTWKIRIYNDASSVKISPADLGLSTYYVGIKISGTSVATSYRTIFQVSSGSSSGTDFSVHSNYDYINNTFFDLPFGTGTYNYQFFISSTATTYSGGKYQWVTSAPSNIIYLPHEGVYISHGDFDVAKFIYVTNPSPTWLYNEFGSGDAIRIYFGANTAFKYTSVPSNGTGGWTVKNSEGTQIAENEESISTYFDVYPNSENTSPSTDVTENIILVSTEDASVTQTVSLTQYKSTVSALPYVTLTKTTTDGWGLTVTNAVVSNGSSTFELLVGFTVPSVGDFGPYDVNVYDKNNTLIDTQTGFYIWSDTTNYQIGFEFAGSAAEGDHWDIKIEDPA